MSLHGLLAARSKEAFRDFQNTLRDVRKIFDDFESKELELSELDKQILEAWQKAPVKS